MSFQDFSLKFFLALGTAAFLSACGDSSSSNDDDEEEYAPTSSTNATGKTVKGSGEMVDPRDGRTYKTVAIGKQVWMAENLKFRGAAVEYSCPGDSTDADCDKYGALYTWNSALYGISSVSAHERGVCPAGWHLPTYTEYNTLVSSVHETCDNAGICLKSESNWPSDYKGSDKFGFGAIPTNLAIKGKSAYALFWTSNRADGVRLGSTYKSNSVDAVAFVIENSATYDSDDYAYPDFYSMTTPMYVRCLQGSAKKDSIADFEDDIKSSSSAAAYLSSAAQYKKSITEGAKRYKNKNVKYGKYIDPRDSNEYLTVDLVGKTWMAENLRYDKNLDLDDESDSASYYLYGSKYYIDTDIKMPQGYCPEGWHIPSLAEWDLLVGNISPIDLLANVSGWKRATNNSGFTLLPNTISSYYHDGMCTSDYDEDYGEFYLVEFSELSSSYFDNIVSYAASSSRCQIRCVKD